MSHPSSQDEETAGRPSKLAKQVISAEAEQMTSTNVTVLSEDCLGVIISFIDSYKRTLLMSCLNKRWQEKVPLLAVAKFSEKVAPHAEMMLKLKAMDIFSNSLKRQVEIFELSPCEHPPPFPEVGEVFELPYEQALQVFPTLDYVLRIVCRRSIEIHRYRAHSEKYQSTLMCKVLAPSPVSSCAVSDDGKHIAIAYHYDEKYAEQQQGTDQEGVPDTSATNETNTQGNQLAPAEEPVAQPAADEDLERLMTRIDIFKLEVDESNPRLELQCDFYSSRFFDRFNDACDSLLAFATGDSSYLYMLSEGIAEIRSTETGRIAGIVDLECESSSEVLIAESGRLKKLSLDLSSPKPITRLFRLGKKSGEDPQFINNRWLVCDGQKGSAVYSLETGERVLECDQWDIIPFPDLKRHVSCDGNAFVLYDGKKQRRIPIDYVERELIGDHLVLALAWDSQKRQQLFAIDVESLSVTAINLTSLLPHLFPKIENDPTAMFYDDRVDSFTACVAANFDRDVIIRFSEKREN